MASGDDLIDSDGKMANVRSPFVGEPGRVLWVLFVMAAAACGGGRATGTGGSGGHAGAAGAASDGAAGASAAGGQSGTLGAAGWPGAGGIGGGDAGHGDSEGVDAATTTCTADVDGSVDPVVAIAAGSNHACALMASGRVNCWGDNSSGQLGEGSGSSLTPRVVAGICGATAIAAGGQHSCALLPDGTAQCWGANGAGELGNPISRTLGMPLPVTVKSTTSGAITPLMGVSQLAAGTAYTCALISDGSVQCWGETTYGQLGSVGAAAIGSAGLSRPVVISGLDKAVAIAGGGGHICALLPNMTLECWGKNEDGQLGPTKSIAQGLPTPVTIPNVVGVVAVSAGEAHTCALLADGSIQCWGYNDYGELGNGSFSSSAIAVAVVGISDATAIAAGPYHTCALLADHSVACWGDNNHGALGNGTTKNSPVPVPVAGLTDAVAISARGDYTCALLTGGRVQCWGENPYGQLGNGSTVDSSVPVTVAF
jgi:alpha-tubulin suppressor-like RCC1 family protein